MSRYKFIDYTGKTLNNWFVESYLGIRRVKDNPRGMWKVRCVLCGRVNDRVTANLNRGNCYCQRAESQSNTKQSKSLESGNNTARNRVLRAYKNSAKERNLEWTLTSQEFDVLISGACHYCGRRYSKITYRKDRKTMFFMAAICAHNGIDRKDSSVGYVFGNCLSCCSTCNYAKRDMSYQDFMKWISNLISYQQNLSK